MKSPRHRGYVAETRWLSRVMLIVAGRDVVVVYGKRKE